MTCDRPPEPLFDAHASDYEAQLVQGIGASGESKEFFARGRVSALRTWWNRSGRPEPRRIFDYGSGIGDTGQVLANYFPEAQVLGLEPSAACVAVAEERYSHPRVGFHVLKDDGGKVGKAGLVYTNCVVHHVRPTERPRLFTDFAKCLNENGILALFENNPLNPATRYVMSRIPFDRDAVPIPSWETRRRVRAAGLRLIHTGFYFYFPRPLRALRVLERLLVHLPLGAQYGVFASNEGRR